MIPRLARTDWFYVLARQMETVESRRIDPPNRKTIVKRGSLEARCPPRRPAAPSCARRAPSSPVAQSYRCASTLTSRSALVRSSKEMTVRQPEHEVVSHHLTHLPLSNGLSSTSSLRDTRPYLTCARRP